MGVFKILSNQLRFILYYKVPRAVYGQFLGVLAHKTALVQSDFSFTVLCKMYLTPSVKYYINRVSLSQDYIP